MNDESILSKLRSIIGDLLRIVITDKSLSSYLGPAAKHLSFIIKSIPNEIADIMLTQGVTYEMIARAVGITEDTDEIGLTLQINEKLFPAQLESRAKFREVISQLEKQVTEGLLQRFRVGYLCSGYKNRLMWSHYADSHRGFCIEYDFSSVPLSELKHLPLPVVYSNSRPQLPWDEAMNYSAENKIQATIKLILGFLSKDEAWDYENEWRYLIPHSSSTEIKTPPISCIYLGAEITPQHRTEILEVAQAKGISVKQMVIDRGEYALHEQDI